MACPFPPSFFHHWLVVTLQQASAEVSKVKIYLYICHLYVHTCEAKLHCILAGIAFLQLVFSAELNVVWRNQSPSLWFPTTGSGWGLPSSETSHRYSSATYLINLPKQAYAFFTSICVHIALCFILLRPSVVIQQLWNWCCGTGPPNLLVSRNIHGLFWEWEGVLRKTKRKPQTPLLFRATKVA